MTPRRDELMAAQYLTAIAGAAALRRCVTEPSVVRDRLGDIRHVVEHLDEFPYDLRIPVFEHPLSEGYALWAERYDGENPAVEVDTAEVQPLLAAVPIGTALDAACGTGRHSEFLVPDAVRDAFDGVPFLLVWRLERPPACARTRTSVRELRAPDSLGARG